MSWRDESTWRWTVALAGLLVLALLVLIVLDHWFGEMRVLYVLGVLAAGVLLVDVVARVPRRQFTP